LRWGVAVGGDESGIARAWPGWLAGADELDAEVPLVAVVEQEQELLAGDPEAKGMASPRSARVWSAVSSSSRQIRRAPGGA
jgi:hypothetical protein